MAKDCPKCHRLPFKPNSRVSSLHMSSVAVTSEDIRTAAIEEEVACGLYGLAITLDRAADVDISDQLIIISLALKTLHDAVPLPTDELLDPLYDPFGKDRFSLSTHGGCNTYLLSDKHNYDDYIVYFDQLCDPSFDIVAWLVNLKLHNYDDLVLTKSSLKPTCSEWTHANLQQIEVNPVFSVVVIDDCPGLVSGESTDDEDHKTITYQEDMEDIILLKEIEGIAHLEEIEDITNPEEIEDITYQEKIEDITDVGPPSDLTVGTNVALPIETQGVISELFCAGQSQKTALPDVRALQRQSA
ncbi:hypothetical protein EV424DRAFT_1345733 [Suillus variegatus]|nr:hypothetical protein EV424DRAFT_1345733 [Suillus variegatus]